MCPQSVIAFGARTEGAFLFRSSVVRLTGVTQARVTSVMAKSATGFTLPGQLQSDPWRARAQWGTHLKLEQTDCADLRPGLDLSVSAEDPVSWCIERLDERRASSLVSSAGASPMHEMSLFETNSTASRLQDPKFFTRKPSE